MKQAKLLQNLGPDLASKNTTHKQMVYGFILLITKGAGFRMWQIPLRKTIGSPNTFVRHKPKEELATRRSPCFPDSSPRPKFDGSYKESCISRFAAIGPILRESPNISIWVLRL